MNIPSQGAIFAWRPACWTRVWGADATPFLQGQFTNELRGGVTGRAVYGLWLNVKGKVIADSFVIQGAEPSEFWLASYESAAATIRDRLDGYIIADDVSIHDYTAEWAGITLLGAGAAADVGRAADSLATRDGQRGWAFRGRRTRADHMEWLVPATAIEAALALFPHRQRLTADQIERLRIDEKIPSVPRDIGPNELPNEGGLEEEALSYTKGCYLGQEVMARLKSMGKVRRKLLRVAGVGPEPVTPAPLYLGDRQVGELRSVAASGKDEWIGLGLLNLLHVRADAPLALVPQGAGTVTLRDAP